MTGDGHPYLIAATVMTAFLHLRRRYDLVQANSLPDTVVFATARLFETEGGMNFNPAFTVRIAFANSLCDIAFIG